MRMVNRLNRKQCESLAVVAEDFVNPFGLNDRCEEQASLSKLSRFH